MYIVGVDKAALERGTWVPESQVFSQRDHLIKACETNTNHLEDVFVITTNILGPWNTNMVLLRSSGQLAITRWRQITSQTLRIVAKQRLALINFKNLRIIHFIYTITMYSIMTIR